MGLHPWAWSLLEKQNQKTKKKTQNTCGVGKIQCAWGTAGSEFCLKAEEAANRLGADLERFAWTGVRWLGIWNYAAWLHHHKCSPGKKAFISYLSLKVRRRVTDETLR